MKLLPALPGKKAQLMNSTALLTGYRSFLEQVGFQGLLSWLSQHHEPDSLFNPNGYLYIIQPDCIPTRVKIGYTQGTLDDLRGRYYTYFPDGMRILYAEVLGDIVAAECQLHTQFKARSIAAEWFDAAFLNDYITYIESVYGNVHTFKACSVCEQKV